MTAGDWAQAYMTAGLSAEQKRARLHVWVDRFRPALDLALHDFLESEQWPERERFRRRLTQRGLHDINLDELLREMPKSQWERIPLIPDRIVLSLQVLQELPDAKSLLDVCIALVIRAYELYSSETDGDPELQSSDPILLMAANGNAFLLACAREVLDQHSPTPFGGGGGTDYTHWTWYLNSAAMPYFRDVTTIDDYLAAQAKIINADRKLYGSVPPPALPIMSPFDEASEQRVIPSPAGVRTRVDLFVIMPFGEIWSDGTYAFIRRAVARLEPPEEGLHLYRADEIAAPGQITDQIKDAIRRAHVVIADITNVNANVMWELGYADGRDKAIVILNQNPSKSPFDMVDRRQVAYHNSPTDEDEANLVRHLAEALRASEL